MAGIKKILLALILLLAAAFTLVYALNNPTQVSLDLLLYQTQSASVAVWTIIAFVLGALLSLCLSGYLLFRTRLSLSRSEKRLKTALNQREVSQHG